MSSFERSPSAAQKVYDTLKSTGHTVLGDQRLNHAPSAGYQKVNAKDSDPNKVLHTPSDICLAKPPYEISQWTST